MQTLNDYSFQTFHFDFVSTIQLTPGETYTLSIVGSGSFAAEASVENQYAAGALVSGGGSGLFGGDHDLVFTEGLHSEPVPSPSSLAALLGMGLMGLVTAQRKRKRA